MKHQLILATLLFAGIPLTYAQDSYDDDIYYNPKKQQTTTETKKKKQSNYIADMADMDVDTYNRRGEQYYAMPIDTIGSYVENGEDFVYTQQIQKYYNPTIVVDNADVLADVLSNAYGNVEIVIDNSGLPVFTPYYGYPYYGWRGYSSWGLNISPWGWSVGFYDPWYAWNWGPSWGWSPSWAWGPSWSWGWGPGWGPSWGWGPAWGGGHHGGRPHYADWRPNGNRPTGPRPGWSGNTRPGGNYDMASHRPGNGGHRPAAVARPGSTVRPGSNPGMTTRPGGAHAGVVNNNGRWEYNTTATSGHRQAGTGVVNSGSTNRTQTFNRNQQTVTNRVQNRVGTTTNTNKNTVNTNRNNSGTRNNYNTNTNRNNSSNRSYNTGRTTNTNRGGGGGMRGGGGGSRGGGGGGRHR